jgi:hypothetical protein
VSFGFVGYEIKQRCRNKTTTHRAQPPSRLPVGLYPIAGLLWWVCARTSLVSRHRRSGPVGQVCGSGGWFVVQAVGANPPRLQPAVVEPKFVHGRALLCCAGRGSQPPTPAPRGRGWFHGCAVPFVATANRTQCPAVATPVPAGCAGAGPASTAAGSGLLLAVLGLVPQAPPLVLVSCWLRSGACPACAAAGVCVGVGVFVSLGNRGAPIGRRLPTVLRKVLMLVLC